MFPSGRNPQAAAWLSAVVSALVAAAFGFTLGLSLAAPPGPMNALIAREASNRGWLAGIRVGTGAPVADVLWLLIMVFGLGALFAGESLRIAAIFGSTLMAFFAITTWQTTTASTGGRPATFVAGFTAAMTNPYQAAWWLSGGFVFVKSQGLAGVPGFLLGIFGWVVVFSWLVAHGAQRWSWFSPAIRIASTGLLAVFALVLGGVALGRVAL